MLKKNKKETNVMDARSALSDTKPIYPDNKGSKKNKSKKKKVIITISIIVTVLVMIGGFFLYKTFLGGAKEVKAMSETFSNKKIELKIKSAEAYTKFGELKEESGYCYLVVLYEYTNKTGESLKWNDLPLVECGQYQDKGDRYVLNGKNLSLDYNAMQSYCLSYGVDLSNVNQPLKSKETRKDMGIYKIKTNIIDAKDLYLSVDLFDFIIKINPALEKEPPAFNKQNTDKNKDSNSENQQDNTGDTTGKTN